MFLSKYGVARHIYIPVVKRAVVDFAVSADWTPAAGDVKISKDGGAAANVTNLPVSITMGNTAIWDFSLTAAEMQAAQVVVTVSDSATKAVEDQSFIIETYGNASAEHLIDFSDTVRAGLTALPNANAGASGGVPTVDANNSVKVQGNVKKDTALAGFPFMLTDSTNHNPKPSATSIVATISKDGGSFVTATNSVVEVANGIYTLDFVASELNANDVILRVTASGCDDTFERITTWV